MAGIPDFITLNHPSDITIESAPATVIMNASNITVPFKFESELVIRELAGNSNSNEMPRKIYLHPDLEGELAKNRLLGVPGLLNHLFPDSVFPITFDTLRDTVYQQNWTIALRNGKQFSATLWAQDPTDWAVPSSSTSDLGMILNKLGKVIRSTINETIPAWAQPSKRTWVSEIQQRARGKRANSKRLPDICLVHAKEGASISWSSVLVPLEVHPNANDCENALIQLTNNAYMIFSKQEGRRFVIGISICATDVRAYVFDRAGIVGSSKFDLNYDPGLFIRLIGGLVLSDMNGIGLDASIFLGEHGFRCLSVAGIEYQIIKKLFLSKSIRGHGTMCWHAQAGGNNYVIKDVWTEASSIQTEVELLEAARGIDNVVQLVAQETVKIGDTDDSTKHIRSIIADLEAYPEQGLYKKVEIRFHRRIVTTPVAEPLTSFRSKREPLQVFISAIEAHCSLVERRILHRDISINNVLILRPSSLASYGLKGNKEKEDIPKVKGILIDFDHAMAMSEDKEEAVSADPAGTVLFMATELLIGIRQGWEHQPHHDLEAFFYSLLWIALNYAGLHGLEREDINVRKRVPVDIWFDPEVPITTLGERKLSCMSSHDTLFAFSTTNFFTDYFKDLIPCINELRHRIFPIGMNIPPQITHQDMIDILRKHLNLLPVEEKWSATDDKEGKSRKSKFPHTTADNSDEEEKPNGPATIRRKWARLLPEVESQMET